MRKNPYLTEEKQTTIFGVTGQGLLGIGMLLPPPFSYIVMGVGLVSTSIGFVMAEDRKKKNEP
jgi:hypothetical protein